MVDYRTRRDRWYDAIIAVLTWLVFLLVGVGIGLALGYWQWYGGETP